MRRQCPAVWSGALSVAVLAPGTVNEVTIIFITPTIVSQIKQQGGNTASPINIKLDYRTAEHAMNHQKKTQFPPQSVSHQEASISLLPFSIRGQTD